ncbi:MAG TPA: hypothetical protein VGB50_12015 [Flavobacterium sp.]|jgi:hypothetical protein
MLNIKNIGTVLCFFVLTSALGQSKIRKLTDDFMCNYYGGSVPAELTTSAPGDSATEVIQQILSVVGLRPNFEIRAANVPNAAAVILSNKRYILYNRKFMAAINSYSGNDWAAISILAHEIGHHLNGHTLTGQGSRPDIELEADEFSGFVLCKMGASLEDAQAAMNVAASLKASHTHPARRDRLRAIAGGWNNAKNQLGSTASVSKKSDSHIERPVIVKNNEAEQGVLADQYIAFDVRFNADAGGLYYITTQGNLVNVSEGSLYLIGRLAESNKRGYKLMLSDKNYNYLYIAAGGNIVNGAGRKVGSINKHD